MPKPPQDQGRPAEEGERLVGTPPTTLGGAPRPLDPPPPTPPAPPGADPETGALQQGLQRIRSTEAAVAGARPAPPR